MVPMTNAIGSLVVSHRFYNRLPDDLKKLLKESGQEVAEKINQEARRDNEQSISLLKKSGIEFMWDWSEDEKQQIRDRAAQTLAESGYIPEKHFTQTRNILEQYRNTKTTP